MKKFSADQIIFIRTSALSTLDISKFFRVSLSTIRSIRNFKSYKDVK